MAIRILAFPAFNNRKSNPFNYMLYTALEEQGCKIDEFSFQKALFLNYDLVHVHWPEKYLNSNYCVKAFFCSLAFLLVLLVAKLSKKKVVWTVHNLKPHKVKYPILNSLFWFFYLKMVDGIISLSKANESVALQEFKFKKCIERSVIHHGLYYGAYKNNLTKKESRDNLGLDENTKVVLFLGQIKPYKNVEELVAEFNSHQNNDYVLLVAGRFESKQYFDEINKLVKSPNIMLVNKFIPDDEIQKYYKAADVCVLPFKNIFNSGSALLSVTFHTQVLVPYSENFREYQEILNDKVIRTYKGEISFKLISSYNYSDCVEFCSFNTELCNWNEIALKHNSYYTMLTRQN